jgi:hypothetical protein
MVCYGFPTHQSRDEHVRGNNHEDFGESDEEVWPARDLDLIKTIEEENAPTHVKNNDGISGKR